MQDTDLIFSWEGPILFIHESSKSARHTEDPWYGLGKEEKSLLDMS